MSVDVKVTENATLALDQIIGRFRNLRPLLMGPIRDDILATEAALFQNAGGYAGVERWAPLTEATMRRKVRGGAASTRILVERGDLERSLTQRDAPGQVAKFRAPGTLEFGTQVVNERGQTFAQYHQLGTRYMEARPVIPESWPEQGTKRWADLTVDYIVEGRL